jgi:hypothetical protein
MLVYIFLETEEYKSWILSPIVSLLSGFDFAMQVKRPDENSPKALFCSVP